jgi:micrococcal nuclease
MARSVVRRWCAAALAAALLAPPAGVSPHGGPLDVHGCHRDRAAKTRHCHREREPSAPPAAKPGPVWRTVVRVVDGDTIVLAGGERVRLIGVNTPETKHPEKAVERFGREATTFSRRLLAGERVRLEFDQERRDRYGRTLAYVYLEDGRLANEEIIRQGYGHAVTAHPFAEAMKERFRAAEREAREAGRGLWKP